MDPLTRELLSASPSLRRLVLALAGDEHLANDLVQDTWLAALRRRNDPPRDPARWARRVIRHLLHGTKLRDVRRREQEALAAESRTAPAPDQSLAQQSFLQVIARTAAELDEPYRTVIHLRYWEDLAPPEIAAHLGRPHDTIKTQLRRGLEILRERLDREHDDDRKAWLAPLRIVLDPLMMSPAPAGLPLGAFIAAAAVPLVAWLGWVLLGEAPRAVHAEVSRAESPLSVDSAPLEGVDAGSRVAVPAPAPAAPPAATAEETGPRIAIAVVDDLGRPMPETEVFVLAREAGLRPRGTTDPSGALELVVEANEVGATGSPGMEDRALLTAYRPGYAAPAWYLVRCLPGSAQSLRIELSGPELVLEGLVSDPDGLAIPGAEVELISTNRIRRVEGDLILDEGISQERTDASGAFTMRGLEPGVHTLAVRASGWVPSEQTVDGRAGGRVECALPLTKAGSVSGIVRDERGDPLAGALLTYDLPVFNRYGANETRTGPDGHYRIDDLPPGRLLLWAQDPERSGLVSRAWVEVREAAVETWDPVLEPVDGVAVRVVDEQEIAVEGWQVTFSQRSARWTRMFATDADGRAEVFDLPQDPAIDVMVRRDPADRFPRAALTGLKPSADEVQLVVSRSDRTGSVIGVLLTEQGMPPADATAWLVQGWNSEYEPVDPSSGEFAFERVPDGTYDSMIIWGGHGVLELEQVELAGGELFDRGTITMPATGRALIDSSRLQSAARTGLRFELRQEIRKGTATAVVLKGPGPPPNHLDLLPGRYSLAIEQGETLEYSPFELVSGQEVQVEPGLTQR